MQTFTEKCAAVESCLGVLQEHLCLIAKVHTTLERVIPDSGGEVHLPPPVPADPHDAHYPPEAWERVLAGNVWRWRLGALTEALDRLSDVKPLWATAVYLEFVEPDYLPEWNARLRECWAAEGVAWIARDIPGEMPYCERGARKTTAKERAQQRKETTIVQLRERGLSYQRIADKTGYSKDAVGRLLRKVDGRCGRPVSAVSH